MNTRDEVTLVAVSLVRMGGLQRESIGAGRQAPVESRLHCSALPVLLSLRLSAILLAPLFLGRRRGRHTVTRSDCKQKLGVQSLSPSLL